MFKKNLHDFLFNLFRTSKIHPQVFKPKNQDELISGIKQFWSEKVTKTKCQHYINHLRKVVPAVITHKGQATGF